MDTHIYMLTNTHIHGQLTIIHVYTYERTYIQTYIKQSLYTSVNNVTILQKVDFLTKNIIERCHSGTRGAGDLWSTILSSTYALGGQNENEKYSHGIDWLQKELHMVSQTWMIDSENVQNSDKVTKFIMETTKNRKVSGKTPAEIQIQWGILQG